MNDWWEDHTGWFQLIFSAGGDGYWYAQVVTRKKGSLDAVLNWILASATACGCMCKQRRDFANIKKPFPWQRNCIYLFGRSLQEINRWERRRTETRSKNDRPRSKQIQNGRRRKQNRNQHRKQYTNKQNKREKTEQSSVQRSKVGGFLPKRVRNETLH